MSDPRACAISPGSSSQCRPHECRPHECRPHECLPHECRPHDAGHMIAFRQVDARFPFLWEDASQPAGRWHGEGEGPAHYFADTPDGAWAEFLRHEDIDDPADLKTIRRQMWAVEIGDPPREQVDLPMDVLTGGLA